MGTATLTIYQTALQYAYAVLMTIGKPNGYLTDVDKQTKKGLIGS